MCYNIRSSIKSATQDSLQWWVFMNMTTNVMFHVLTVARTKMTASWDDVPYNLVEINISHMLAASYSLPL
jgi:hypothetical protein